LLCKNYKAQNENRKNVLRACDTIISPRLPCAAESLHLCSKTSSAFNWFNWCSGSSH